MESRVLSVGSAYYGTFLERSPVVSKREFGNQTRIPHAWAAA